MGQIVLKFARSPRDSSPEKTPVKAPRKTTNAARHSVAQRKHSKKRKRSSSKNHRGKNKRTKFSRRYSSSSSASESSESSSSSSDSDSSDGGSSKNTSTQHLVNESAFEESKSPLDPSIVNFAAESAFQGLKKSTRKNILKDSSVPFHADLRPKKVDSFVKMSKNI